MGYNIVQFSHTSITFAGLTIPVAVCEVEDNYSAGRFSKDGVELKDIDFCRSALTGLGGNPCASNIRINLSGQTTLFPTQTITAGNERIVITNHNSATVVATEVRMEINNNGSWINVGFWRDMRGLGSFVYTPVILVRVTGTNRFIGGSFSGYAPVVSGVQPLDTSAAFPIVTYSDTYALSGANSFPYISSPVEWLGTVPTPTPADPYSGGGISEPSGPNTGTWEIINDDIDFPAIPTISAADSGFFSIWTPTLEQIQLLAQFMWTTDLTNIDTWKRLVANPIELILGLSLFPFDMTPDGHEPLTIGIINSRIETNYRESQFFDIDCGTIDLEEYYGAFLDYAPYTELDIYLPYIGVRTINVNDVMPKTLHLRYRIDLVTGSCVAMLKADNSVFYHFSGSCAIQIPVTTYQMQDMIKSAISAASSIIGGIATGGVAGALAAVSGTSSAVASAGQHASRSGAIGSAAGFLSVQKPYLIITRPRQAVPQNQSTYTGYPAFITAELGDLEGYTEVEMIHLHDVPATSEELDEIERLLTEGVIF